MAAAPTARPARGFALRDRLLLFTFGIVVLLLALSLGVIDAFVRRQVRHAVAEELVTTGAVFDDILRQRSSWLRSQSLVVAEDPRFSATLDLPDADPESLSRTVRREARRFQSILASDLFVVTDARGLALAWLEVSRTGRITARRPLDPVTGGEVWSVAGRDYDVVSRPVGEGADRVGAVAVGFASGQGPLPSGLGQELEGLVAFADLGEPLRRPRPDAAGVAWQLQRSHIPDLAAVADADGAWRLIMTSQVSSGQDLSSWPTVVAALGGREVSGLHADGRRLYHLDGVPVWSPDGLVGALVTGFEIDDELAGALRDMTHSHVTFFGGDGRLVASTWDEERRRELAAQFRAGDGHALPYEMTLGDETFLSRGRRFGALRPGGADDEGELGTYLIQRSLDEAFEFLHTLEEVLLLVGVGVLALGAALSFAGARRITRPVGALVEGTRRLAAGHLDHRIVERSRSELGELARSFNDMAATLKTSREALEESEHAYRDLFDNAQDLVLTTDLERRIATANQAGLESLGYTHDELRGRSFYDLVAEKDRRALVEREAGMEPGMHRPPFEAALRRRDGREATFEIVSRWIVERGQAVGIHAIGRDITQRREREQATIRFREQLAQAEKLRALGEMAAGVAHNFNNLLTVVVGNAELICLHEDVPEPIRKDTERILESARRCSAIVRRIQTFGRPIDMDRHGAVDLNQVVRDTVDITRPRWKTQPELAGRTVRVHLELQPVPPIRTQGSAWEEILSNLIFNAVDAMPEGGRITVSTAVEAGRVVVRVADEGTGMDEETKRRIFEPFFSTKAEGAGTGLGLSTVWGLVQTLGGQIAVATTLGKGSTFAIDMPIADGTPDAAAGTAAEPAAAGLRILIVDDEPQVLELLPPILAGHRVDIAGGGAAGLQRASTRPYDIVLSDWVMADASGLEIAAAVKGLDPDAVMVLMTGWQFRDVEAEGRQDVDLLLSKPFEREDVERVLAEAARLREERLARRSRGTAAVT